MTDFENIPQSLRKLPLWCNWKYIQKKNEAKPRKFIYNPVTGVTGAQDKRDTFSDFNKAVSNIVIGKCGYNGIGLGIFGGKGDPSVIDIDDCIVNGVIDPLAQEVIDIVDSYTEISPSGNGIHIFFFSDNFYYDKTRYKINNRNFGKNSKGKGMGIEVYTGSSEGHYATVSGKAIKPGAEVNERSEQLYHIAERFMLRPQGTVELPDNWQPISPALSDEKIIDIILHSESEKAKDLWEGNWQKYPDFAEQHQSGADQSFCNILAFYTQDAEQIDRIFRMSGLYRDKWERQDYSTGTIEKAIAYQFSQGKFFGADSAATDFADIPGNTNDQKTSGGLNLMPISAVEYKPPDWLIEGYILRGKLNLIQGNPGVGKTAFAMYLAACVSAGKQFCGIPIDRPHKVLLLSVEDDPEILRGRLEANGADLDRCLIAKNDETAYLSFESPVIEDAIASNDIDLVIFDPFQMFLGAKVDINRANETRPVLSKLAAMATRNNCAVVLIAHNSKSTKDKAAVNNSIGSVDIPAAMRTVLNVMRYPGNKDIVIATQEKNNTAKRQKAIKYTIGERAAVSFIGFEELTADELAALKIRSESNCSYEDEPFVKVIRHIVKNNPGGGKFSYEKVIQEGYNALGVPLCSSTNEISGFVKKLGREIHSHDGIEVTHNVNINGKARGIGITVHRNPQF